MTIPISSQEALASPEAVIATADYFALIAEALHLSIRSIADQRNVPTEKAYGLITEEYGLRTRLGILRTDANNRVVLGVGVSQVDLNNLLLAAADFIRMSRSVDEVGRVFNSVSVLCVSIFPGKDATVKFLINQLQSDLSDSIIF
jgi:hypothetical protein